VETIPFLPRKLKIILILNWWRKKLGPIYRELKNFLPEILSSSSHKYGFGIRDPEKPIPDPGVKKAPDPVSATLKKCSLRGTGSRDRIEIF
jgi:hypothetical protein